LSSIPIPLEGLKLAQERNVFAQQGSVVDFSSFIFDLLMLVIGAAGH